jgi:DNA-directed RNA polymerase specialized sigma24 family protein
MEDFAERTNSSAVTVGDTTVEATCAIRALSDVDLLRLKAIARVWARGLPDGLGWADVLNEAIARVLDGSRRWPPGVPLLAFLSGVMRSICDDYWRRARRDLGLLVRFEDFVDLAGPAEESEPTPDPERVLAAGQALAAVDRMFAGDPPVLKIIAGLADGLTAKEICRVYGLSECEYDTARKRMRRAILRSGLAWSLS